MPASTKTRLSRVIFLIALLAATPIIGSPQSDKPSNCNGSTVEDFSPSLAPKARAFLANLKAALRAGDKQKLASTAVQYPLNVNDHGSQRMISNASEFLANYDRILTPSVIRAVEKQVPGCLFANWQGVMIGDGEVWFEKQRDGSLKIKTINVP